MTDASEPLTARQIRRDGWTPERRQRFLELLAAGLGVRRACAGVGLSRQAAYALRRREPAFVQVWDEALQAARRAAEEAFLAMLPEKLPRTVSGLSGECKLGGGVGAQDCVRSVRAVNFAHVAVRRADRERMVDSSARHAELVSASISPSARSAREERWTLNQVQGDEKGRGAGGRALTPARGSRRSR